MRPTALLLLAACAALRLPGTLAALDAPTEGMLPVHGEPPAPTQFQDAETLVETERLGTLLGDGRTPSGASLAVVDARSAEEYANGHLPGAWNLESDALQDEQRKPYGLPAPETLAKFCRAAGINAETRVVVYDAHAGRLAARVWFILYALGHDRVSLLDGGLPKWREENRPVTRDAPPAPSRPGSWSPARELRGVVAFDGLKEYRAPMLDGRVPPTLIIDARSYGEYTGRDVRAQTGGHIPGAVNLAWDVCLRPVAARNLGADHKGFWVWRDPVELHALLRAAGVVPGQSLAVYDQSGGRSSHLMFTLRLLGFQKVVNYTAGWREYGSRRDAEIER